MGIPRKRRAAPATKTVNLALQGGGSHGAFAWGVLDRLIEDGRLAFEGISATSAGAMNAAVLAWGWTQGGRDGAREALAHFWRAVSEAGAFAVVLEGMAEPLAAKITREISTPTIGIGASAECDGQILVMEDMLGLNPNPPKFVRQYAHLGPEIEQAVKAYAKDVRERRFPGIENVYSMKKTG